MQNEEITIKNEPFNPVQEKDKESLDTLKLI